jgi:hypothetical protein
MISTVSGIFLNFSRRVSYLSFPPTSMFALNECAQHKLTQSSYQLIQIHTFWYHQLFHFVLTCMESLSHFVALHPLLNNGVNHQIIPYIFFKLGPLIKLSRQPNMCLSKHSTSPTPQLPQSPPDVGATSVVAAISAAATAIVAAAIVLPLPLLLPPLSSSLTLSSPPLPLSLSLPPLPLPLPLCCV